MDSKEKIISGNPDSELKEEKKEKIKEKSNNEVKDIFSQEEKQTLILPLEKIENLDDFDEKNYPNRKYNQKNLDNAKKFFKLRYLKTKLKEFQDRISSNITKDKNPLITLNEVEKEKFLKYENLFINYEKTKEKNIQKYTSLFLISIEKSIIYFNIESYKESYEILLNHGIIKNPSEFGEVICNIKGYDKTLIGDFILQNGESNFTSEFFKGFSNSIEMDNLENILDILKQICNKLIIPEDTRQKTVLINELSSWYYETNKDKENFVKKYKNDRQNVGILLNSIINTINSFGKGKTKINKEEFIIMVDFIDKEEMSKIYDKIKNINLKMMDYDYLKDLYERFIIILGTKGKKEKNQNDDKIKPKKDEEINYYFCLEEKEFMEEEKVNITDFRIYPIFNCFTKKDMEMLTFPFKLFKVNGVNSTNAKEYMLLDNFEKIAFEKNLEKVTTPKHYILINDVIEIYMGTDIGENFKKYLKANPQEENNQGSYISIITNKEQVDLKSEDMIKCINWFKSLKCCLIRHRKHRKHKDTKIIEDEQNKVKEEIESIWNSFILKKWETYGSYFLFKCLDHENFLSDMNFDGKNQTSSIKIDIFDEKKLYFLKVINNFLKEVKEKLSRKEDRVLEYNEFFVLCQLGIPDFSRKNIWPILIGNKSGLTNLLYKSLKEMITQINNFNELELKYKENLNINFTNNFLINKIIKDIIKFKYLFLDEIIENKIDSNLLMSQIYSICICFYLHRFDISYNKNIISIIYFLLIKKIPEKKVFISLYNLIFSCNSILKLYQWDEKSIKILVKIFEESISEYLPQIKQRFDIFGINCSLYLFDWIEGFYTQILNQKIASIIFDLYLIYGEYILIQTGITILKLLEGDILSLTIDDILILLKSTPITFDYLKFFDTFRNYNGIKEKFRENNAINEYEVQSGILLGSSE